jgi:tryptophan synthase alpha subunit
MGYLFCAEVRFHVCQLRISCQISKMRIRFLDISFQYVTVPALFLIVKDVSFCYSAYYFCLTVNKSCVESLVLPDIVEKNVDKFEIEKTKSGIQVNFVILIFSK